MPRMEDRSERIDHYLRKAEETRALSTRIARDDTRRSFALLAAMWTALARHMERASEHGDRPPG
jgi:hypothetical protein